MWSEGTSLCTHQQLMALHHNESWKSFLLSLVLGWALACPHWIPYRNCRPKVNWTVFPGHYWKMHRFYCLEVRMGLQESSYYRIWGPSFHLCKHTWKATESCSFCSDQSAGSDLSVRELPPFLVCCYIGENKSMRDDATIRTVFAIETIPFPWQRCLAHVLLCSVPRHWLQQKFWFWLFQGKIEITRKMRIRRNFSEDPPAKWCALEEKELSALCLTSKALKFVLLALTEGSKFLCVTAWLNGSLRCLKSGTHCRKLPL